MEFSSLHRHPFHLRDGQRRPDTLRACPESLSTPVTEQFHRGAGVWMKRTNMHELLLPVSIRALSIPSFIGPVFLRI